MKKKSADSSNICPTLNIKMVMRNDYHFVRNRELDENGYKFTYISGMYLFYFCIWKNFYFTTKKDFKVDRQFYFRWLVYLCY